MHMQAVWTHTLYLTFPIMQGQTLSSEAHWDNLQRSSSTGSCPPVHKYTHGSQPWTWCPCLTVGNTPSLLWVFVQHAGQRRREAWGLLHNHAGQLSWLRWLLVGTMTFNRKDHLGEKHQEGEPHTSKHTHTHTELCDFRTVVETDIPVTSESQRQFSSSSF